LNPRSLPGTDGFKQHGPERSHVGINLGFRFKGSLAGEVSYADHAGCLGGWRGHLRLTGLDGLDGITGRGNLMRLLGHGGIDEGNGLVHGVPTLPLQVKDLGDAGLAGDADLEVLARRVRDEASRSWQDVWQQLGALPSNSASRGSPE